MVHFPLHVHAVRLAAAKEARGEPQGLHVAIENCALGMKDLSTREYRGEDDMEWEFKCPVVASLLTPTDNPKVDYCSKCKENVYLVDSRRELREHVDQGHCVAFDVGPESHLIQANKTRLEKLKDSRPKRRMMGKMARPQEFTQAADRRMPAVRVFYAYPETASKAKSKSLFRKLKERFTCV